MNKPIQNGILCLLASIFLCIGCASKEKQAEEIYLEGLAYYTEGNFVESEVYFKKALLLYEHSDATSGIAMCLHALATLYAKQENYALAESYYNRALPLQKKIGDSEGAIRALSGLIKACEEQGKQAEVAKYQLMFETIENVGRGKN